MPFKPDYKIPEERQPYELIGHGQSGNGRVGCLVLHGFMGSPGSSRPMAEYLAAQGITVYCPLLPGHGHYPDKLYKVSHRKWLAEAEEAMQHIRQMGDELFIISHSMGAVLAAHVITKFNQVKGLVMLTPLYEVPDSRLSLMPILRYFMPWLYPHKMESMQDLMRQRLLDFDPTLDLDDPAVQARLPEMTRLPTSGLAEMVKVVRLGRKLWSRLNLPTIIFHGGQDPAVRPGSIEKIYERLPHKDKILKVFPEAGHELMRPFEPVHTKVWQMVSNFIEEHSDVGISPAAP